jgi:hypothetical protein
MTSDAGAPAGPRPLDPGLLKVIRTSIDWLSYMQDAFMQQMRSDMGSISPALGNSADGWVCCERIVNVAIWAAMADQPPHEIAEGLRWVGAANHVAGFPEGEYVSVAHALVRTVHVLSGSRWSTATGSAWISYFMWMKPYFLTGAQQAVARAGREAQAPREAQAGRAGREARAGREPGPSPAAVGEVDLESAGSLLEEEDDEDPGYGQIMVSMTHRQRKRHPD